MPHEWEEGSVQWLWNQFCALRVESNAGDVHAINRMEWILDTIVRYRLAPFVGPEEAAQVPSYEACEDTVRARVSRDIEDEYRHASSGFVAEELESLIEGGVHRAAVEARADPVAKILARLGWLEPLRPEKARV